MSLTTQTEQAPGIREEEWDDEVPLTPEAAAALTEIRARVQQILREDPALAERLQQAINAPHPRDELVERFSAGEFRG